MLRKIIITFAITVFALFIVLVITAWALGAFATVDISLGEKGPYYLVSFPEHTSYRNVPLSIENLKDLADSDDQQKPIPAALVLNDPMGTPLQELQAFGGYLFIDSVQIAPEQKLFHISKRLVVTAHIEANPTIATFKTYPALYEWLRKNYRTYVSELPYLEIYHHDGSVSVEMMLKPLTEQ